ncbi:MAG TPA: efflux RND transporter periplasmic adaptor subunit [Planctomycetota bacterium]|nr:efflux RND transporter periplasmic adaptor subunit [Planctomycetota bacterium]
MKRMVRIGIKLAIMFVLIGAPVGLVMTMKLRPVTRQPYVAPRRTDVEVSTVRTDVLKDLVVLPVVAACPEDRFVKLAAEMSGKVVRVHKRDGDSVEKGETIIQIDTEMLEAQLNEAVAAVEEAKAAVEEAKATITEAQKQHERALELFQKRFGSEENRDAARAQLDRARAGLTRAEAAEVRAKAGVTVATVARERGNVRSAIRGTVNRRYVDEGGFVAVGQVVAEVVDVSRLYAVVDIPERDRQHVDVGAQVALTFRNVRTGNPGGAYVEQEARVRSVSDIGDQTTRTYRTQIEFDNPRGLIKPGMLGTVQLQRGESPEKVVVPKDYIVPSEGETLIYVAAGDQAVARRVLLGLTDGRRFVVEAGLQPGELIIRGARGLASGELIRIRRIDGKDVPVTPGVSMLDPGAVVRRMLARLESHETE